MKSIVAAAIGEHARAARGFTFSSMLKKGTGIWPGRHRVVSIGEDKMMYQEKAITEIEPGMKTRKGR